MALSPPTSPPIEILNRRTMRPLDTGMIGKVSHSMVHQTPAGLHGYFALEPHACMYSYTDPNNLPPHARRPLLVYRVYDTKE